VKLLFNPPTPGGSRQESGHGGGFRDAIVFMDNDVVVAQPNWIEALREALFSRPDIGSVSPKLIYPNAPHWIQCAGCDVSPEAG